MSTRWYPLYQKGNPQLRIFLPNFWLKLVKPEHSQPKNIVVFHCSMEMTRYDVKNYLEKIYKVPVIKVNTRIAMGKFKKNEQGTIIKKDDIKFAYVSLPRYESFEFPNMFDIEERKKEKEREEQQYEEIKKSHKEKIAEQRKTRPGIPTWFNY
ncbi:large ribosomal subunit protein uL23m [Phymastichus coffea]|uniref:large ribosomal subunit protein uL23m n=1 Tax=Phymastichus coffea TaxID=108790 RepID=UPI00273A8FDB|nr:large ribosomal subunit protein uL23m [Phymastichus coffea]